LSYEFLCQLLQPVCYLDTVTFKRILKDLLETLQNGRGFLSCVVAQGVGEYSIVVRQILAVADGEGHASPTGMQRIIFAGKIDEGRFGMMQMW